jgi:uncharacterized lipoprotein YddW (UPF0748 family)
MMNRKHFLKVMGTGLAGVAAGTTLAACGGSGDGSASGGFQKHWAWMRGNLNEGETWQGLFATIKEAGIDGLLLQQEDPQTLREDVVPAAQAVGLDLHIWIQTMMRGENVEEHPDWYAVNRNGVSTAEDPPYVDYYRFMSPCVEGVRDYLANHVDILAQVDGVQGVHLDYIRFPDVILPTTLQPQYDLVQDQEYPEFDYGYHPACRAQFEAATGADPVDLDDPPAHAEWVQFRYDQVTQVVSRLAEVIHGHGKLVTAAVFPTPDIARRLVRQNWPAWPLDAVMPMMYHNFYDEPVRWIRAATELGRAALDGRVPLYSGLFIPELAPDALRTAVDSARAGGASGITLFSVRAMTEAHWARLRTVLT